MKTIFFKGPWLKRSMLLGQVAVTACLLTALNTKATTVTTLGGGPSQYNSGYYGDADGSTKDVAQFHTPIGLALDSAGQYLYVADRDNNAIRILDLTAGQTYTFTTDSINQPVGVAVDGADNVYVLNRGDGSNGSVLEFDSLGDLLATNATSFTNAAGIALDYSNNVYVTASNQVFKITSQGVVTNVATITDPGASLAGVIVMGSGKLAVCDAGRDGIYNIDPSSGVVTTNTGFNGPGDHFGPKAYAKFLQPYGLAEAGNQSLVVADYGNNRVKVVDSNGTVTNLYGVDSNYWVTGSGTYPGWWDGTVAYGPASQNYNIQGSVESRLPSGIVVGSDGTAYVAEDYYHVIREVSGGLAPPPQPPPPPPIPSAPVIGYVTFPAPDYLSVLTPVSSFVFNNDVRIAIKGTNGALTYFTFGQTGTSIPDPSTNASTARPYQDGLTTFDINAQDLGVTRYPDMTIKAMSMNGDGKASPITSARFKFVTATPTISGNNAGQFTVNDLTSNALMYYTLDGTEPTTSSIGPIHDGDTLSLNANSDLTFNIRAFRSDYLPSGVLSTIFYQSNYVANTISFGFGSGEASSDFVGSPGQLFYAPVTLTTLPNTKIYSLQFNMTVTNAGPNPGPSIAPGAFGFVSKLMKPLTNGLFQPIPPYMFIANAANPPPPSQIVNYSGEKFVDLETIDTNLNLLGVGWLERYSQTNLYNTVGQTLITYSLAHDDLFPNPQHPDGVVVGGYSFLIPGSATNGQTYQIRIGRPSATDDGIGAPGSDVYIAAPTSGALSAAKTVTIGLRKYLAGDAYPFRWFNAGDFGDSRLNNADVEQVFQSAIYSLNYPPFGSDFFDSMDSCGGFGFLDSNPADADYGYYTNAGTLTASQENTLFSGNDSTINQIAFGDGHLDVCDVYVTFRRSLDPSLNWFRRFWLNGERVAETVPNVVPQTQQVSAMDAQSRTLPVSSTNSPQVNFVAGDIQGSPGQVIQVPITAQVLGDYPLRVLMLNLTVEPLDGSPMLTTAVSFTPNQALGSPTMTDSDGLANYAAAWLDSTIAGLTGEVTVGTLTVTIPANATSLSAYAVHFDHASASPNGLASFPRQTMTGLITLSSRTNSTYNDGIPDSWRLRWFGTVNNLLSVSNACPSGDGVNNWQKYVAGVDPNTPNDFPSVNAKTTLPAGATAAIHWPSVSGKHYVVLRSSSLFSGGWTPICTNTGTGGEMEFDDNTTGQTRFYRVQILP